MVIWLSFALGLLPAIVWLVFFLQEDKLRPEPKGLIISTFIAGGLVAFVALGAEALTFRFFEYLKIADFDFLLILFFAAIEEFFKFLAVLLWARQKRSFDEPIDAMIYMIVAALGFATVENIASALNSQIVFELVTLRFIGATLLHALSSSLVGYYWARGIWKWRQPNWAIVSGLFIATLVHFVFNGLTLKYGPALHVTVFLALVAFFVLNNFEVLKRITVVR